MIVRNLMTAACGLAMVTAVTLSADANAGMASYMVVEGDKIPEYLSGQPGDAKKGRSLAITKKKGNCLACHTLPIPEQADHGQTGPDLNGVGSRMREGELRMRMVDAKVINPDTMMPSFYKVNGLNRVLKKFQGKTVLSAKEIDDIVAYLMTLKDE